MLLPAMHDRCPVCDLKFEREEGYFLGAMYIGYSLALATIAFLTLVLWFSFHWHFRTTVVAAVLLFVPLVPLLTVMARVLWIYLDQAVDPDKASS